MRIWRSSILQLEKLIGKVKTEKYGVQIVAFMQQYLSKQSSSSTPDLANANGNGDANPTTKKRRKAKDLVVIESSEDGDGCMD